MCTVCLQPPPSLIYRQESVVPAWVIQAKEEAMLEAVQAEAQVRQAVLKETVDKLEKAYNAGALRPH
jgi:hypothetical protein